MSSTTIFLIAGIVLVAIFFLIARLAIRWIIKLTMFGIILIALLGGAFFWWWTNRLASIPPQNQKRSVPAKRANAR